MTTLYGAYKEPKETMDVFSCIPESHGVHCDLQGIICTKLKQLKCLIVIASLDALID